MAIRCPSHLDNQRPIAPSADSSAVTDAGAQSQQQSAQRKARRCWSPELHRRFVAALQHLGGPQASDGDQQQSASAGQWPRPEQYTTSQHSSSQSGSPQGPLQLTVSSRGMLVTVGDSCDGGE
ncbi:hypothetical protein ZWY2020_022513 [Hordeum vulgare]|nr:hypothetical protein ZWY2020_022513 [Hordeum vulgare]